jgi:hypothetical protein
MDMARNAHNGVASATRYVSAAGAAAPVIKKIMQEKELRDDVRQIVDSARDLYEHLDEETASKAREVWRKIDVHKNVDKAAHAAHSAADTLGAPRRSRRGGRGLVVLGVIGGSLYLFFSGRGRKARDLAMKPFHRGDGESEI